MSFLLGYLCGIATVVVFAWHLSRTAQSKPEATQHNRIVAASIPMDPNAVYTTTLQDELRIFRTDQNGAA